MTRGDIYRVLLPRSRGHEQAGSRYAVIVQTDELIGLSTAIVAPTSRSAAPTSFRPEIEVREQATRVMVEQLRAVDLDRLREHVGRVSFSEQSSIDDALALALGL